MQSLCQACGLEEFLPFRPENRIWGLNQWKFALESWLRMGPFSRWRKNLRHLHTPGFLTPDVYTVHGLYACNWLANPKKGRIAYLQFALLSALERRMIRRAGRVVFVSRENLEYAENTLEIRRPGAFQVINPGVDCEKFTDALRSDTRGNREKYFPQLDPRARWLLFVGHDFARKGLPGILKALATKKHLGKNWKLLVFGNDPVVRPSLDPLLKTLGEHVFFFESDRSLPQAFGLSDQLVLSSVAEGYPLVLLEAMAGACIPFVTRFQGTVESVVEGHSGFLFDDVAQLVDAALRISDAELEALRPKARAFALQHTWSQVAESYERIYASLENASGC